MANTTAEALPPRAPLPPMQLAWMITAVVLLLVMFRDGLAVMTEWWAEPEYQHGYIIPIVSLYFVWAKAAELAATPTSVSPYGLVLVLMGLLALLAGELSSIYVVVQYAFLLTLWGLVWTAIGWRGVRVLWAGLAFLVFMIPLPRFFQFNLSNLLQLWSSEIGTAILRLMRIPVYLEGNVIDLGSYQLQVVEACSGLRYLFPLMSFGFFCAYIFRGALWQKALIFLSAAPIAIVMNSFRIAVTGVLVNQYGIDQAEGFLHYFEGWIIFVACIALLFMEMSLFALLGKRKLADAFEVEIPELSDFRYLLGGGGIKPPLAAALVLLAAGATGSLAIQNREEAIPQRVSLASFPMVIGEWQGRDGIIEPEVLDQLKLTDFVKSTYVTKSDSRPIDFYVAYYDSQRKGASVHSPKACLPGGGWVMEDFGQRVIADARADGMPLEVNRAVIAKGQSRAVVYYWFMQRGRYLTNEYLVKWYIFWDALTRNRTDGAMVRVMVPVADAGDLEAAESQAEKFIRAAEPKLYYHIPQDALVANQ